MLRAVFLVYSLVYSGVWIVMEKLFQSEWTVRIAPAGPSVRRVRTPDRYALVEARFLRRLQLQVFVEYDASVHDLGLNLSAVEMLGPGSVFQIPVKCIQALFILFQRVRKCSGQAPFQAELLR